MPWTRRFCTLARHRRSGDQQCGQALHQGPAHHRRRCPQDRCQHSGLHQQLLRYPCGHTNRARSVLLRHGPCPLLPCSLDVRLSWRTNLLQARHTHRRAARAGRETSQKRAWPRTVTTTRLQHRGAASGSPKEGWWDWQTKSRSFPCRKQGTESFLRFLLCTILCLLHSLNCTYLSDNRVAIYCSDFL
jgi:hypothetical protein